MGHLTVDLQTIRDEFNRACRDIRQANKGGHFKPRINTNWELITTDCPQLNRPMLTLRIRYFDHCGNPEIYNIAL